MKKNFIPGNGESFYYPRLIAPEAELIWKRKNENKKTIKARSKRSRTPEDGFWTTCFLFRFQMEK